MLFAEIFIPKKIPVQEFDNQLSLCFAFCMLKLCLKSLGYFQYYKDPVLLISLFILGSYFQNNLIAGKKLKNQKINSKSYCISYFEKYYFSNTFWTRDDSNSQIEIIPLILLMTVLKLEFELVRQNMNLLLAK